jgi:large repetitive protein
VALANDTGTADDDGITTDAALTITAEAGSTVRVFDGDTELGIATEGAPGQFSFTPVRFDPSRAQSIVFEAEVDGKTVTFIANYAPDTWSVDPGPDGDKYFSSAQGSVTVVIDGVESVNVTPISNSFVVADNVIIAVSFTNDKDPGTPDYVYHDLMLNPGFTGVIGIDKPQTDPLSADAVAAFLASANSGLTLPDGAYTLTATATDAAGNVSDVGEISFTLDTTGPEAPVVSLTTDTGASTDDALTNDAALTITAEAGSTVRVFDGDTELGVATEGAPGQFSFAPAGLSDGAVTLTATATDAAGNVSDAGEISFTLDTAAPAAPVVALANDTGTADDDGITTDAALTITAEAGSTVRVFDGDTELGIATEGAPGQFSFTPAGLADGSYTLTATATDAAGNVSDAGEISITLDTAAPAAPVVRLATDSGSSATDGVTNDGSLTGPANLESGATVEYRLRAPGDATLGEWTAAYVPPPRDGTADGDYIVDVRQIDAAGNISPTTRIEFRLDTVPPVEPDVSLLNDTGTPDDLLTSDGSLSFSPIPAGATRSITVNGAEVDVYAPPVENGTYTVVVTDTDLAGNTASETLSFTLDTTAPTAPEVALTSDTGVSAADRVTSDPSLTVTAEPGSTVRIFNGQSDLGLATETSPGSFTFVPTGLPNGVYTFTATATDPAGNVSAPGLIEVTLDRTAPNPPTLDAVTGDNVVNLVEAASYTLTGTAEPGATVTIAFDDPSRTESTLADGSGRWTIRLQETEGSLPDDEVVTVNVRISATDAAGNQSGEFAASYTVDARPAVPPTFLVPEDDSPGRAGRRGGDQLRVGAEGSRRSHDFQSSTGTPLESSRGRWKRRQDVAASTSRHRTNVATSDITITLGTGWANARGQSAVGPDGVSLRSPVRQVDPIAIAANPRSGRTFRRSGRS